MSEERERFQHEANNVLRKLDREVTEILLEKLPQAVGIVMDALNSAYAQGRADGRNEGLEEAAKESDSFLGELPADKWPPHGLYTARGRFDSGVSAKAAIKISLAIRALKKE